MPVLRLHRLAILAGALQLLAACGSTATTEPAGELTAVAAPELDLRAAQVTVELFDGLGAGTLSVTSPVALSLPGGTTGELKVAAGTALKGSYDGTPWSATVPSGLGSGAFALAYKPAATLWLGRYTALYGTAYVQLANLTASAVQVSYTRAGVNGGKPVAIGKIGATSAGPLVLDLRPSAVTFTFRDAATSALVAEKTITTRSTDSVALALFGSTTRWISTVPGGTRVAQQNRPPVAAFTATPSSANVGDAVTFDASASSDPDGDALTYAWAFGNGATASGKTATTSYAAAGSYTVTLTVTDPKGLTATASKTVTILQPNRPPVAAFTATPSSANVGDAVTFDASASSDPDGDALTYAWTFGNGATASGKTATTSYAAAGSYTVTLAVTDPKGLTATASQAVTVTAPAPTTADLVVTVRDVFDAPLGRAVVSIGSATALSDGLGVAHLAAPAGQRGLLTVKADGYLSQALETDVPAGASSAAAVVFLKGTGSSQQVQASAGGIVSASADSLGVTGSVAFQADAFVDANNAPVTGLVDVRLTPFDVNGADLVAFPGNGLAVDLASGRGALLSFGMMDVSLTQNGRPVRLAQGKTATLELEVPAGIVDLQGLPLAVGDVVPLWWFDEASGSWVEEGAGTVVAKAGGSGLALAGTVSHFTTWNWDVKMVNGANLHVECQVPDGAGGWKSLDPGQTCYVYAALGNGYSMGRSAWLDAGGVDLLNLPGATPIYLTGWVDGWTGGVTASTSDVTVTVRLGSVYHPAYAFQPDYAVVAYGTPAVVVLDAPNFPGTFTAHGTGAFGAYQIPESASCGSLPCLVRTADASNRPVLTLLTFNETALFRVVAYDAALPQASAVIQVVQDTSAPNLRLFAYDWATPYGPFGERLLVSGLRGMLPSAVALDGVPLASCSFAPAPCLQEVARVASSLDQAEVAILLPDATTSSVVSVTVGAQTASASLRVERFPAGSLTSASALTLRADRVAALAVDCQDHVALDNPMGDVVDDVVGDGLGMCVAYVASSVDAASSGQLVLLNGRVDPFNPATTLLPVDILKGDGFLPPSLLRAGTAAFDMTAGANIPFPVGDRTWEVLTLDPVTRLGGFLGNQPLYGAATIDQDGRLSIRLVAATFLVRVRQTSNPANFIETVVRSWIPV